MKPTGLRGRRPEMEKLVNNIRKLATPLLALCLNTSSLALGDDATVIVSATRFAQAAAAGSANVSVITQGDIARSPARSIPDLLKSLAGIDVRPLYGSLGLDATVDIRGSGETAVSNTLILIDGQRLNPVDLGSVKWETIPLSAIKQIEVIRGSGAVLYGDRASNGVVNIITDKSDSQRRSVSVEAGSFGYGAVDAALAGGNDAGYGRIFARDARSDGYRVNSDTRQTAAGGRLAGRGAASEVYLDFSGYQEKLGLPSELTRAQFDRDPRQSTTPHYRMERSGTRLHPGTSVKAGNGLEFEVDGSVADDRYQTVNPDWFYRNEARVTAQSLSPRLKLSHQLAAATSSSSVFGVDAYSGRAVNDSLDFASSARTNRQRGEQSSSGFYAQNNTVWQNGVDSSIGLRRQLFSQKIVDEGAALSAERKDHIDAWDLGLGYRLNPAWRAYAKAAATFRLPSTDELFAYDPNTFRALFNGALKPQTGRLLEAGVAYAGARYTQRLALFQQKNRDEIGFIADNFRNANLDPTRRRGLEWEGAWSAAPALTLRGSLTLLQATFSEGIYAGKDLPLVPRRSASVGISWDGAQAGSHSLNLLGVGHRPMGGDFMNLRDHLSGYATLDYQAQWKWKPYALVLRVANLGDRKYSASGFSSAYTPGTFYPADPRSVSLAFKAEWF